MSILPAHDSHDDDDRVMACITGARHISVLLRVIMLRVSNVYVVQQQYRYNCSVYYIFIYIHVYVYQYTKLSLRGEGPSRDQRGEGTALRAGSITIGKQTTKYKENRFIIIKYNAIANNILYIIQIACNKILIIVYNRNGL